jgi:mono/diheme cytochrome c family protein
MDMHRIRFTLAALVTTMVFSTAAGEDTPVATLDFNRDIRPILSENCFACHGPDKKSRKADFRLDTREGALSKLTDDTFGIVPGKPYDSTIINRITSDDLDEKMPPKKSGKTLNAQQIETLKAWVAEGAAYKEHWSLLPPEAVTPPAVKNPGEFVKNPIDQFILARLEKEGLAPSKAAPRITLIRRLSFDLTGLPPAQADVDAFLKDTAPDAYEKVVDRLLASPRFGERMAVPWLDEVRFADTIGYHSDNPRDISPYRDYVIRSFNANLPFNQFTIEQIAGDLLEKPTLWQKVASGYNRLLQTTEEGGAQAKEYEAKYAADRVRNISAVWLASTMICSECHDHKFDPTTQKDFYSMAAFFADIKEATLGRREAGMLVPTPEQEKSLAQLDAQIGEVKKSLDNPSPEVLAAQTEWENSQVKVVEPKLGPWFAAGPYTGDNPFDRKFEPEKQKEIVTGKTYGTAKFETREFKDGEVHNFIDKENVVYYLYRDIEADGAMTLDLSLGSDDGIKVFLNMKEVLKNNVGRGAAPDQERLSLALQPGKNALMIKIANGAGQELPRTFKRF